MDGFDYVIIGAGAAGCVLANRLSADPRTRVLLVEAGGEDRHPYIHIPAAFLRLLRHERLTWGTVSAPDPATLGRPIVLPRGRVLGGSTAINGLVWIRGLPSDFDHWAQNGNHGWSYDEVLPFFVRSEDWRGAADPRRGRGGPTTASPPDDRPALCEAFRAAGSRLGFADLDDLNADLREGMGYYQQSRRGRLRCGAVRAYLAPARGRPNLLVWTRCRAHGLLVDGGRVVGAVLQRTGQGAGGIVEVRAGRAVLLAAGAIGSPHLLLLSGIGPERQLRALGVPVRHDLPGVGADFHDHFAVRVASRVRHGSVNGRARGLPLALEAARWLLAGRGLLTSSAAMLGAFARSRPELALPDLQLSIAAASYQDGQPGALEREPGMTCGVWQMRPASRGTVELASADPEAAPRVTPGYLRDPGDQAAIVAGLKLARTLSRAPELAPFQPVEILPGDGVASDDEWLDYARSKGSTVFHYAGTCRMGADARAVVDARLRVHGLDGLRVVDASVMPTVVSANTHAATAMIAEKAADMIAQDAR